MPTARTPPDVDVPVVIVGAGPVGLTAALLLARRGVRSLILEQYPAPYPLPRAVHVDDEAVRVLQQAGLAGAFARISRPAAGLRLLAADHRVIAEFRRDQPAGRNGHPPSNLFDQPDLEHLLRTELTRHPEAELRTGIEVTGLDEIPGPGHPPHLRLHHRPTRPLRDQAPGGTPVRADAVPPRGGEPAAGTESVTASAVLGCDGANSLVRGFVGARWDDLGFEERWLVLDVRCRVPLPVWDGVEQICDPVRAATAMRIGPDRYRWEFRLHPSETVAEMIAPHRLSELLRPWTETFRPAVEVGPDLEVLRAVAYTFRARLADRWRRGRVFLAGDAAHLTPPFIGQGLGSGLRDVHNLVWKLALVLNHPDRTGDELLLDSYQQERRPHARTLIRVAVLTGWAMTGGQNRAAGVRRVLLRGFCRLPGATALILEQTGPPLSTGPFVHRTPRWRRLGRDPVGTLVPQPWVDTGTGPQRLDDVLGPGFAIITTGPVDPALTRRAAELTGPGGRAADPGGVRVIHLVPAPHTTTRTDTRPVTSTDAGPGPVSGTETSVGPPPRWTGRVITSAQLQVWMRAHRVAAVLVRPDRTVLAAARRTGRPAQHPGQVS